LGAWGFILGARSVLCNWVWEVKVLDVFFEFWEIFLDFSRGCGRAGDFFIAEAVELRCAVVIHFCAVFLT